MNPYDQTPEPPDPEWIAEKRRQLVDAIVEGGIEDRIFVNDPMTGELRRVIDIYVDRVLSGILGGQR